MPSRRRLLLHLALFLAMWANIEVFCRNRLIAERYETGRGIAQHDPRMGWRIREDSGRLDLGRDGAAQAELRVLCLGTSVTWGIGVDAAQAYPACLERDLRAMLPGRTVRVYNAGLPGAASHQCLALLDDLWDACRPDIVIVMLGENEQYAQAFAEVDASARSFPLIRRVLYCSPTYRYLLYRLRGQGPVSTIVAQERALDATAENVRLLDETVRSRGARLLVAAEAQHTVAWTEGDVNPASVIAFVDHLRARLEKTTADRGIAFVDLVRVVPARGPSGEGLFRDMCHLTPAGCERVAKILADRLMALGWLPAAREVSR